MLKLIKNLLLLSFLFYVFNGFSQSDVTSKGKLVWADEFEGTGIPNPAKWDRPEYNRRANENGPDGWWSKEDSYLDGNGNLVIRVRKIPNKNTDNDEFDYSCGAVRSKGKFEQLHGIFEIRCKLPTQQGWWVAFWMMQGNVGSEANGGVDGSEVDIMEAFGWNDKINQAVHWDGYGDAHKSIGQKSDVPGIHDGYHTYTMEWYPDIYIFYIDGNETWRSTGGGVCNQPGYVKVTGEISTESWAINQYWSNNPAYAQYPDSFLVDYVRVYEFDDSGTDLPIRDLIDNCYPDGNLQIGSACHGFNLGTPTEEILDREFNYVTPANDFKQSYVHPEPGVWKWQLSDEWIKHCRENNQVIRLHAPISPQCSEWAKTDTRTAAELEQNMTEYMTELCKRYNDSTNVKWLDVVNETVSTDGTWFGPKDGTDLWENPWPQIGYDETVALRPPIYIKKAFEIANEYAPNIKQIINQHGGMEPAVWDKIKSLVSYLRENNLRVDGIGWQAHIWKGWEKEPGNMERLAALIDWCHENDLEFHITEFNVWLKPEDLDKLDEQADTFYEIVKLAAEKQKTGFVGVNFWHIRGVETQNKDRDGGPWAEDYTPKEAYYRIKEALCQASEICKGECSAPRLILDVDTFKIGSTINMLGGEWLSYSDNSSTEQISLSNTDGFESSYSAKFEWVRKKGSVAYPYSVFQTYLNETQSPVNLNDYYALKFQCKGTGQINVGLMTANSVIEGNHYFTEINLKNEWNNIEIPFSELAQSWGTMSDIDTSQVIAIVFSASTDFDVLGEMWIDNIQFISENAMSPLDSTNLPKPVVYFTPKANQLGYLPNEKKEFTIITDSVATGQEFSILNSNDEPVFSGNLGSELFDDTEISGETVYLGEFSAFKTPGEFRIKIGDQESYPFEINEEIYDSTLNDILRFFYLVRANDAINDPVTGLSHPEAHLEEQAMDNGFGDFIDVTGGWYNAGDYGKWVHTTAFACEHLMNLYEVNPNFFKLQDLNIPESENEIPDLLDQVRTGINWILKMQLDDGSVFHKIDSEPNFAYGFGPDEDPHARKIADPNHLSTIDAADFAAAVAHASRVFEPYDTAFSQKCKTAALKSWDWVKQNRGIGQTDIYYTDPQTWQEEFWATAEIFLLTKNQSLLGSLYSDIQLREISLPTWTQPNIFSYVRLYQDANVPSVIKSWIKTKIENYATGLKSIVEKSGYGIPIDKFGWGWGSNTKISNYGATFIYAYQISGNEEWLNLASQQLDYLLGRNSLNYSFVTGTGKNFCEQPYHWITKTYNIVPPGLIGQGATGAALMNQPNVDKIVKELMKADFPPAKTYVDSVNSWNSNEVGILSMSSLAYLTGFLAVNNREVGTSVTPGILNPVSELEVIDRNNSLYCENSEGEVNIFLYTLNGQLIYKNSKQSATGWFEIVDYSAFVQNNSILLFKILDDAGKMATGKLTNSI